MEITRLSSKGQVIIPKAIREEHQWQAGLEFIVLDMGDGILLKPKRLFAPTSVADVAGCLDYTEEPKTLQEMQEAVRRAVIEAWHDSD